VFDFFVTVNQQLGESQMADLQAKLDEIKATIEAEKAEVATELADLGGKIDALKAEIEAGKMDETVLIAGLDEIKAGVEGIFSKTVEPPVEPETPAE
jgi:chromosome segregation ATPase